MIAFPRELLVFIIFLLVNPSSFSFEFIIRESVDSVYRDDTDTPIYHVIHIKALQTFQCLNSKAIWIAYCVSGVVFYP